MWVCCVYDYMCMSKPICTLISHSQHLKTCVHMYMWMYSVNEYTWVCSVYDYIHLSKPICTQTSHSYHSQRCAYAYVRVYIVYDYTCTNSTNRKSHGQNSGTWKKVLGIISRFFATLSAIGCTYARMLTCGHTIWHMYSIFIATWKWNSICGICLHLAVYMP